jgi:Heterokaryon incompatibility protein (HET)
MTLSENLTTADQTCRYEPLKDDDIRLVRILNTSHQATEIRLELVTYSFEEAPAYVALSYTWGRPSDEFPEDWDSEDNVQLLHVNGYKFNVRQNLFAFFQEAIKRATSSAEEPRMLDHVDLWRAYSLLWVDAISIDQQNISERNKQVTKMGKIYQRAENVICWLGPHSQEAELAVDLVRDIDAVFIDLKIDLKVDLSGYAVDSPILPQVHKKLVASPASCEAFGLLMRRKWFRRAWVVQESTAVDNPLIWVGSSQTEFGSLVFTNMCLYKGAAQSGLDKYWSSSLFDLLTVRIWREQYGDILSLLGLMTNTRSFQCTDPRDKIYSMLSMASTSERTHNDLLPNYGLSVNEVYQRVAKFFIQRDPKLSFLGLCSRNSGQLPSWAPNWATTVVRPFARFMGRDDRGEDLYSASKGLTASAEFLNNDYLCAHGVMVDTVMETSTPCWAYDLDVAKEWFNFATEDDPYAQYLAGDTKLAALNRVICANSENIANFGIARLIGGSRMYIDISDDGKSLVSNFFMKEERIARYCWQRKLFKTTKGHLGLCSYDVKCGDLVCILFGSTMPTIMERTEDDIWKIVCEAYVDGIMEGEAVPKAEDDESITKFKIG